ncbi:hypothetical protein ABGT15_06670 [Flavobacterium enshiense]|uniref:hypothetical protein n=1 Tax=Flavobacterium enshiense TaxID=1341165 RepID=UPI00345DA521
MKKLLLLVFMMFCLSIYSQSKNANFTVIKIGNKYSKEVLTAAFQKADMCGNFYFSKSNDIVLDDGSVVRLLSRKEMQNGSSMSDTCFMYDDAKFGNYVWSITANGYVAKGVAVTPNKSYLKS